MRTYDILNAGPKNRFMANGKIVSNSGALIQPQNLTRPSTNNMNIPEGSKPLDNYDISEMDIELAASGNLDLIQQYWKDPKVLASDCLRAMIHARKGYDFICADYSGIEARALAYLAGEEYVLQGFRDGLDPYKVAATTIYGVKYEDVDKKQRQVGKTATLACGYGGGYGAFLRFGADRMGIDEEEGKKIIAAWRDGHPMTVKLWHKLVEAAVMAMTNKGGIYSYRGVSFQYYKRFLLMKLPSGRFLFYFEPKLEDVEMAWSTPEKPAFKKLVTAMTLTPEKQFVRRPLNHLIISENCFSGETKVLTDSGWKCIKDITLFDKVFDGEKFVFHGGLVCKGKQPVQTRLQVRATKDHLILVGSAWKKFSKMEKSDWYTALEVGRNLVGTVFNKDFPATNIWSEDMSKQESEVEVFDIKNCGDLHRYCVLTSEGPIIVHNCTQAFCRDLMVNAMFNLEEANYPVVFHVHDEIIAEVLKGFGSVEEFESIMCKLPQWAEGLPVKAEGWRGEFYRK